jgi:dipeptidyl-peptidase-4
MKRQICILILAAAALQAQAPQKKPVTLEALSGARPPASMRAMMSPPNWLPDGQHYIFQQGPNVMLYDVAAKSSKELFSFDELEKLATPMPPDKAMGWENRRVSERPIQISDDGKEILLSAGGDLFLWKEGTAKPEQLTATAEPERSALLSPDGKTVAFRRGPDIYALDVATKKTTRLTFDGSAMLWNGMLDWVYPEELDLGAGMFWSPDSQSLAYLQFDVSREQLYGHVDHLPMVPVSEPQRYPKAGTPNADVRVGVVKAAGGPTRWMDYGETRDHLIARVNWTPDSRRLVVHRLNRVQDQLELLAGEVESGKSSLLMKETDPAWINVTDDFHFLKSGAFLTTSERDGFRHVYLFDASGKQMAKVTSGDYEVSVVGVDEARKRVFYISSERSPLERQLYSIGFDGKGKKLLTPQAGTHRVSMSPTCDWFIDNHSSLSQPSRRTLNRAEDGGEAVVLQEPDRKIADEYDIQKPEIHTVKADDGTVFYARMIKPPNFDAAKKYPAIVMVYGGPHAQSVTDSWSGSLNWEQVLAAKGFVIWQLDNRGSSGRGHAWEAKLYRRLGQQELEDQKTGVRYLLKQGFVDPKKIGVYGWSYGGYMTVYSMLHAPEIFAAGVAGAAVTDWRNYDTIYTERYLGLPQQNEEGYRLSSPVNDAAKLEGRLLLLHNLEDDNVLFANFMQLTNALQLAGKPFQEMVYPQKSHGVSGAARNHMNAVATQFFVDTLRP